MDTLTNIGLIRISAALLWKGTDLIVDSAAAIARRGGISELGHRPDHRRRRNRPAGAGHLSAASLKGRNDIILGNLLGSDICFE